MVQTRAGDDQYLAAHPFKAAHHCKQEHCNQRHQHQRGHAAAGKHAVVHLQHVDGRHEHQQIDEHAENPSRHERTAARVEGFSQGGVLCGLRARGGRHDGNFTYGGMGSVVIRGTSAQVSAAARTLYYLVARDFVPSDLVVRPLVQVRTVMAGHVAGVASNQSDSTRLKSSRPSGLATKSFIPDCNARARSSA